ncbi:hypothetical protein Tco_1536712 [Tanacetum coccineum]
MRNWKKKKSSKTKKKADPLIPPPPASDSESEDVVEVEDTVEPEDETILNSVHEVGESSTTTFLREDGDSLLPSFMRSDINSLLSWIASLTRRVCGRETTHALVKKKRKAKDKYYGKLIADLGNKVRCSVGEREVVLEDIIKDFGNAEERVECKKLKKELEEARIMPPKSGPMTQAAIEWMITSRINVALTADRARRENVRNNVGGSGQGGTQAARECTFAGFMKCNPTVFHGTKGAVELQRWFKKTKMVFGINECAEGNKVKFASATL